MLTVNTSFFLRIVEDSPERILHPGKIISINDDLYLGEMEESELPIEPNQQVLIYYEIDKKFMQQTCLVQSLDQSQPTAAVAFRPSAEAVCADSRNTYRVCTVMAGLTARVGSEEKCQVMDVSASGFSVTASGPFRVGATIPVTIYGESQPYSGTAVVQNIKSLRSGRQRFGLHATETPANAALIKGLSQISAHVQRQHLRRLARAS